MIDIKTIKHYYINFNLNSKIIKHIMKQKLRNNCNFQEDFVYEGGNTQKKSRVQWTEDDDQKLMNLIQQSLKQINWKQIAINFSDKKDIDCISRWREINPQNPNSMKWKKKSWTQDQDAFLIKLIEKHGPQKWTFIAQHLPGRIGKQCRQRWHNHLNPSIKKQQWTDYEQWLLFLAHKVLGNSWAQIARYIIGRTDNSIKNHWNSSMKKRINQLYERFRQFKKITDLRNSPIFSKLTQTQKILLQKLHKVEDQEDIKQAQQKKRKAGFQITSVYKREHGADFDTKKAILSPLQKQQLVIKVQQKTKKQEKQQDEQIKLKEEKLRKKKKILKVQRQNQKTIKKNIQKFDIMVTPKKEDKYTINNVFISPPKLQDLKDYHSSLLKQEDQYRLNTMPPQNIYKSYESPSYLLNLLTPEKLKSPNFSKIVLFKNNMSQ